MTSPWLEGLNPAQHEAVTYGDGPLLVVAGAGTGKTMTLACRVARLIDQGVAAERILLLTFTRRAAAEMIRRAEHMTGHKITGRVWGGTFHAVSNRLLRIYGRAIGLPPEFTVMDETDAADLMNLVRNEHGLGKGEKRFPQRHTLVAVYSRTVNAQEQLAGVLKTHFPWCLDHLDDLKILFEGYTQQKRAQNLLDYDDLLLLWSTLCAAPGVGAAVADRFEHILVDEYQDTNAVQALLLRAMRKRHDNIMVVGDDAQSIYSFRAATVRNILDFPKEFPGTHVVTLEQNYRSVQPILTASNAVMEQAKERYTKNLFSGRRSGQKPILVTCLDEPQQTQAVCEQVLGRLEAGIPLMHQAVLFRAGNHSAQLEIELTRRKIPFHKYGGLKFVEMAHIKDMLAFLRILENPYDQISWFRVLQLLDGIGPKSAQRIMDGLGVRRVGPAATPDAMPVTLASEEEAAAEEAEQQEQEDVTRELTTPLRRLFCEPPQVPGAAREQFDRLRRVLADCCGVELSEDGRAKGGNGDGQGEVGRRAAPPKLAVQLERLRQFYQPIFEKKYEHPAMRLRDIEQLEQIAGGYRSRRRFVADLTLDPPRATSDLAGPPFKDEDYLVLSTIHSAKGCEYDVVYIIHAADGMIPSDMALDSEAGVDEERRLFYVAMTRAKDELIVYFPLKYYHHPRVKSDTHGYAQLTRFINKNVLKCFERRTTLDEVELHSLAEAPVSVRQLDRWTSRLWE